jgi:hypothetical protein
MHTHRPVVVLLLSILAITGCAKRGGPVTVELTGTAGAPIEGYYLRDGRRVQLPSNLPVKIEQPGISQVAVRKRNVSDSLSVAVKCDEGGISTSAPPDVDDGLIVDISGGLTAGVIPASASLSPPGNSVMVLSPYRYNGTWVFDDPVVGLLREAFVSGVPEMIDEMVKDIPRAREDGFRLTFAASPFPGHERQLTWVRAQDGGNVYRMDEPRMEGWLCPAMFRYFKKAPKNLYVRADPKTP